MEKENWLLEETLLHEKYQIKKVLGQGGFGITYLAYDQTLQQNVAIKEYFPVKIVRRLGNTLEKDRENMNYQQQLWFIHKMVRKKNI